MTFKPGNIVSHSEAQEWGAGKVLEVTINRVTIQFSDGISRKIAASHYTCLVPASESSYSPPADVVPAAVVRAPRKTAVKRKQ